MRPVWVVNDWRAMIPGTTTLWDDLLAWIPGALWAGGYDYDKLPGAVEAAVGPPGLIIRNASYFRPLAVPCPTISLLQDIFPERSPARAMQVEVCRDSALTIFNSEYTASQYPELLSRPHRIIPLPVDFDLFRPINVEKVSDICWVGAPTPIKGWDRLLGLIRSTDLTFTIVNKSLAPTVGLPRTRSFSQVAHADLPTIISSCRVALCTSRDETQHLAGIEMAGCGLPVVAPPVGCYWPGGLADFTVGDVDDLAAWTRAIGMALGSTGSRARWVERFGREACRAAWLEAVGSAV